MSIRSRTVGFALLLLMRVSAVGAELTEVERRYVNQAGTIQFCVDPDWAPFEIVDDAGHHVGIGADLLALVAQRTGLSLRLLPTRDWTESIAASQAGRCQVMSLLNQTPARDAWLIFTQPILTDDNVVITREEHPNIANLKGLSGKTMVLPKGTSIEERVRRHFPNIKLNIVDTEAEALQQVSDRQADMTLRSLIVAAYTIKREGWFNLKIAGEVPGYGNQLRVGVSHGDVVLRDILNKGVASITTTERQKIINGHIAITMITGIDYGLVQLLVAVFAVVWLTSLYWLRKLNRLNKALTNSKVSLQQAKDLAEETVAQQRQFIAMLSHEVRTPLAVIDATAQLLDLRLQHDPTQRPLLERIRRGAARLSNFFTNCLTNERIYSPNFTVQPCPVELAPLVTWAKETAEMLSSQHVCHVDIEPVLPALQGDQALLRILLMNLITNALKYAPAHTEVTLRVKRNPHDSQRCCIEVQDQGPGISAEELSTIFQKYQRGSAAQATPGAGLGLALVVRVAQLHGGTVRAESAPGQGTRFVVDLPFLTPTLIDVK